MLKSYRWWWVGGGPCDFSVSPSPFGLDFGTLDFGLRTWDFGLGLDNIYLLSGYIVPIIFQNTGSSE